MYREPDGEINLNYLPPIQETKLAILISILQLLQVCFGRGDGEGSIFTSVAVKNSEMYSMNKPLFWCHRHNAYFNFMSCDSFCPLLPLKF